MALATCIRFISIFLLHAIVQYDARRVEPSSSTCPLVVSRAEWKARPAKNHTSLQLPVPYAISHHTAMARCFDIKSCSEEMRIIQNLHMDVRGWNDIGYQFLVGEDGRVYEGRGWNNVGAQTLHWNTVSIGISVMGDFTKIKPKQAATDVLRKMYHCGVESGAISKNFTLIGHRQAERPGYTECPGDQLLCAISTWQPEWKPLQANGTFVMPKCLPSSDKHANNNTDKWWN